MNKVGRRPGRDVRRRPRGGCSCRELIVVRVFDRRRAAAGAPSQRKHGRQAARSRRDRPERAKRVGQPNRALGRYQSATWNPLEPEPDLPESVVMLPTKLYVPGPKSIVVRGLLWHTVE